MEKYHRYTMDNASIRVTICNIKKETDLYYLAKIAIVNKQLGIVLEITDYIPLYKEKIKHWKRVE